METGYRLKTSGDKIAPAILPMVSLSMAATGPLQCAPSCSRRSSAWMKWLAVWLASVDVTFPGYRLSATDPSGFPQARANGGVYPADLDLHLMNSAEYPERFGGIYRQVNLVQNDSAVVTSWYERSRTISLEPNFDNKRQPMQIKVDELPPVHDQAHILG